MTETYLSNVNILLVEDNRFTQQLVRQVLRVFGARTVRECQDGTEALEILQTWPVDIVIVDWEMSPVNGIELTRNIRKMKDSYISFLPVIMLTAHSEKSRIIEARDSGVNEYVVKPLSALSLFKKIQSVIEDPRPFIQNKSYFGPDRRRKDDAYRGEERRVAEETDQSEPLLEQEEIDALLQSE